MELREALEDQQDLVIVYVMADNQVNAKSLRFLDEMGLRQRIRFAVDPGSQAIDRLGLRKQETELMEAGVPHPTTYLIDRDGRVRLVDVRRDYHIWIDPSVLVSALSD